MSVLLFYCHRVKFCNEDIREDPNLDPEAQNSRQAMPQNIIFTLSKRKIAAEIFLSLAWSEAWGILAHFFPVVRVPPILLT